MNYYTYVLLNYDSFGIGGILKTAYYLNGNHF